MTSEQEQAKNDTGKAAAGASRSPREIPSDQLFHGAKEVLILHRGEVYRLRKTRNGKLILNK